MNLYNVCTSMLWGYFEASWLVGNFQTSCAGGCTAMKIEPYNTAVQKQADWVFLYIPRHKKHDTSSV